MSFETHDKLEVNNPAYKFLSQDDGVKVFNAFKQIVRDFVFLVDISISDGDSNVQITETYFYDDIKQALNLIHQDFVSDSKIAILSQRFHNNDDNNYSVSNLTEIIEGVDSENNTSYIFKCQNGKVYIDSLHAEKEKEVLNSQLIYFIDI